MDANELGRWTRFALKGGIGKGSAIQDCVAEEAEDLMFLKDDEIVVLMQLPEQEDMYLGYCEGVVGRFRGVDVRFYGRLKKPVMAKRSSRSLSRSSSRPPSSMSNVARESIQLMPQHRDSPSLPAAPAIISRSFSSASLAMSNGSSPSVSAMPSPVHEPASFIHTHSPQISLTASEDSHMRSESHSSSSTALDSAPRTPADFTKDEPDHTSSLVRIVSVSRQVSSPTDMSSEGHELVDKEQVPELPPVPAIAPQQYGLPDEDHQEMSYLDSEPSTRISAVYSEGDAVEGIGLSLLQNFIGGEVDDDDDDDDSIRSFTSRTNTPEPPSRLDTTRSPSPVSTVENDHRVSVRSAASSIYSTASPPQAPLSELAPTNPVPSPPASPHGIVPSIRSVTESVYSTGSIQPSAQPEASQQPLSPPGSPGGPVPSVHSEVSSVYSNVSPRIPPVQELDITRTSLSPPLSPRDILPPSPSQNSMHPSMTDSDYDGAEWEGASDIYDNYRYSRYSMASKASRFSRGSMHTVASAFGLEAPPPVPFDGRRPSLDSLGRSRLGSTATASSSVEDVRRVLASGTSSKHSSGSADIPRGSADIKRVPPPLDLQDSQHTKQPSVSASVSDTSNASPLLHGSFGSPLGSPTPASTSFAPWTPSPIVPLFAGRPGGAATAIRQRLEGERDSGEDSSEEDPSDTLQVESNAAGKARSSTQPIVIEDDEAGPRSSMVQAESSEPLSSPPTSPSAASEKKRMIETTFIVANQAPPPPYSPEASQDEFPVSGSSRIEQPVERPAVEEPLPPARPRPAKPDAPQNDFMRQSLFMPHPHAPKPAGSHAGPMYARARMSAPYQPQGPPASSAIPTLHMALAARGDPHRPRRVTLYGMFEQDLSMSVGPVPISFTLEPPNNIPANKLRAMTAPPVTPSPASGPPSLRSSSASLPQRAPSAPIPPRAASAVNDDTRASTSSAPGAPIPRPNFFPKTQTPRPRSRSFSGFDSTAAADLGVPREEGADVGRPISQSTSANSVSRPSSSSSSVPSPSPSPTPPSSSGTSTPALKPFHKPSPLSLSQNIIVAPARSPSSPSPPRSPTSPLSRSPIIAPDTTQRSVSPLASPTMSLGQASLAMSPPAPSSSLPSADSTVSRAMARSPSGASSSHSPVKTHPSVLRHSKSSTFGSRNSGTSEATFSRTSFQGRRSGDTDASHGDSRSLLTSPTPFAGPPLANTLKSKLSLPALKMREIRNSERPSLQEERSPTLSVVSLDNDKARVQVKDVDFEMVKPNVQHLASIHEDTFGSPLPSPVRPDMASLRADSPAFSMISGVSSRQPSTPVKPEAFPAPPTDPAPPTQDPQEVEAHRQRELKWITMMSTVPASQARKNKKIRKLLWEGVPASVRYLVWAHLTDSKAKRIEGLYSKMVQRERVPAAANIERDLNKVFPNDRQLHDGCLLNVLQAYLSMVPDTHYNRGLTVIAGHLLLQSPEEDAFWTFVSLMDAHLRPYFSASAGQMEADAILFGKAVESMDSALAKKLFVEMDIPPASLCRPWFSALFLEALPLEYSQRVWDIFLFEGVSFLFRVGLAIISCCKQTVLRTAERDPVLHLLLHPSSALLPPTADAFLEIASSVKLKDDDIRKQRTKLAEAQAKRPPQSRNLSNQTPKIVERVPTPSISIVRG